MRATGGAVLVNDSLLGYTLVLRQDVYVRVSWRAVWDPSFPGPLISSIYGWVVAAAPISLCDGAETPFRSPYYSKIPGAGVCGGGG